MNTNSTTADPTRLGTVEDIAGQTLRIKLAHGTETGLVFVRGEGYRVGQVGSFVRIPAGYIDLYGIVSQVGAGAAPEGEARRPGDEFASQSEVPPPNYGNRWMKVELLGQGGRGRKFERGISQHPTIGDIAHVVTESDLATIYAPGDLRTYLAFGRIASAESIPAYLDLNKLVPRHSALVGSTGAGKSTTVASLLGSLADPTEFPGARIVLLDLHGEYTRAFGDRARVFRINANSEAGERPLYVPFWALSVDELTALATGPLAGLTAAQFADSIAAMKRVGKPGGNALPDPVDDVTADTPVPFCLHQLWHDQHSIVYATHSAAPSANQSESTRTYELDPLTQLPSQGDPVKVQRPKFRATTNAAGTDGVRIYKSAQENSPRAHIDTLEARLKDPRLSFLFNPGPWAVMPDGSTREDLDTLFAQWVGHEKPITVLDLSGVPPSIVEELVGAVLRILFDGLFWSRHIAVGARSRPLLIALEEAHTYLQNQGKNRAALATRRIAKEGRKYGVGLMLISQRPSEIDPTILSQCGTIMAMRLTNESDRAQVRACAADNLDGLFSMLPILRTGEMLVVGEAVGLPLRALVSPPPEGRRPDSGDPFVVAPLRKAGELRKATGWKEPVPEEDFTSLLRCWRAQDALACTTKPPAPLNS